MNRGWRWFKTATQLWGKRLTRDKYTLDGLISLLATRSRYSNSRHGLCFLAGRCSAAWLWSSYWCATVVTRASGRTDRKSTRNTGGQSQTCIAWRSSPRKRTLLWVTFLMMHVKLLNWHVFIRIGDLFHVNHDYSVLLKLKFSSHTVKFSFI